ncbi:hypothetical protein FACS1894204_07530 [Synergistales bacterium]|nr:hypothetical protein FACS1894204_07530 [Synergistales bacterium]
MKPESLKILTCFKVTHNLDEITAEEWNERMELAVSFMSKTIGMYDESALELALRLSDEAVAAGREAELTALSVGDALTDLMVRSLFAVQYTSVVNVLCDHDLRFRPDVVAEVIFAFICKNGCENGEFDFILTGQQANVGDNEMTHVLLSERLGIPCVLNVIDASFDKKGLRVTSLVDDGILEQTISFGKRAVLAMGNAAHPYLRVPTLREKMLASKKSVTTIPSYSLVPEFPSSNIAFLGLSRKKTMRNCRFIDGENASEKALSLYESFPKTLKGNNS